MEKRRDERVGFRVWADNNSEQEISLWLGENFQARDDFKFCYSSKNISKTGMFLETMTPLDIDDELNLEFTVPGIDKSIVVVARVIRVRKEGNLDDGMGVEFVNLSVDDKTFIEEFIEKYNGDSIN